MAINPADSQKCANELAGKDPFTVVSTHQLLREPLPDLQPAGIPTIVARPITIGRLHGARRVSIGAGGGCLGVHTGLVYAATQELKAKRVAVPWADTPPGRRLLLRPREEAPRRPARARCPATSELAGTIPDLEHIGVPDQARQP